MRGFSKVHVVRRGTRARHLRTAGVLTVRRLQGLSRIPYRYIGLREISHVKYARLKWKDMI